jgi:hypothetical protein
VCICLSRSPSPSLSFLYLLGFVIGRDYVGSTFVTSKHQSTSIRLYCVGGERSTSCPSGFTTGDRAPGFHWIGGWMDPRAGLDHMQKILASTYGLKL